MEYVWYLSIAATMLQAALSLWLLRREFRKRLVVLRHEEAPEQAAPEPAASPARAPA
jgi:ABC-type nickel/cobalt efflux system permease component RcnA